MPSQRQIFRLRKRLDQPRDVAAGGLHFDRHRNRVAVVFDDDQHRRRALAGRVQRLPELAFAGRAFADRHVDDLVGAESLRAIGDLADALVDHPGFGGAERLQTLRAGRAALRRDVQLPMTPVRRHLTPAGVGVVLGAHRREQHLERGHAERQAQRAVAVVRVEPVVAGAQVQARRRRESLRARRR